MASLSHADDKNMRQATKHDLVGGLDIFNFIVCFCPDLVEGEEELRNEWGRNWIGGGRGVWGSSPSGIVSRNSAANRIQIRIAQCERHTKRQKLRPCETKEESVLKVPKGGPFHAANHVTREADGIAAKLLQCRNR